MKIRIFLLAFLWVLAMTLQAQSYDKLWKKVYKLADEDDLPKSALVETQRIFDKAKSERNVPQMMEAYFMIMSLRGYISPDSIPLDVKGLEDWAESPEWEVHERAVLYSILGGVHISKDFEKGDRYLKLSLKDSLALIDYPTSKMKPLVRSYVAGGDNLLHFLARRAIELWERNQWRAQAKEVGETISQTYQMLAGQYKRKGNREGWVLTMLDAYPNATEEMLRQWIAEYGDLDVCAEVYLKLAKKSYLKRAEKVALLREAIKRYPKYARINALKNEEKELIAPYLDLRLNAFPDDEIDLSLNYRELKGFTLKFYRLELPMESEMFRKSPSVDLKKYGKLFSQEHFDLEPTPEFKEKWAYKKGKPLPVGIYYWEAIPDGYKSQVQGGLLHVTRIGFVFQHIYNRLRIITVDRKSGHPIPYVEIVRYEDQNNQWERKESYQTNQFGGLLINKKTGYYQARLENDSTMKAVHIYEWSSSIPKEKVQNHVRLFTDRSVYRPGQRVHYSGLVYDQLKDSVWVKAEGKYQVILRNADWEEVASQEVVTDEFGTFNGTFELPQSGKLGQYQLVVGWESARFRVEAYKRPSFEVTFDTLQANYQVGDSVRVKGRVHTYAGIPVQEATVKYRINIKERYRSGRGFTAEVGEGVVKTDAQGVFEVPVHFIEDSKVFQTVGYEVSADVTSLSGETQNGSVILPLDDVSLSLDLDDWEYYESRTLLKEERKPLTFKVTNQHDSPVSTEVDYRVYAEMEKGNKEGALGNCLLQAKTKSNQSFVPEALYALPSGKYRLKCAVWDEKGRKNEMERSLVLFSERDNRIPLDQPLWIYQSQTEFDENGEAVFYYGTREKDVTLMLDRFTEKQSLGTKYLHLSDMMLTFRCRYKKEWGNGLRVVLSFVKDGKIYSQSVVIKKPEPKKQLEFQWKTFRDKLYPGSKEQWTLRVLRPGGTPADARLLATMYDASLDAFSANNWFFRLMYGRVILGNCWQMRSQGYDQRYFSFPIDKLPDDGGFGYGYLSEPYGWPVATVGYGGKMNRKVAAVAFTGSARPVNAVAFVDEDMILEESSVISTPRSQVKFRENFAETAFFYPQLRTDVNGEVDIEFTLPESLTEWKFMGLAHTKDMFYGNITEKVVARKEFMVQPNLPRFVRVGDQVNIVSSLMNLSNQEVRGVARMELFVPETEKVVLTQERSFKVNANGTEKVTFSFDVTDKYEGLGVRIVADGGMFSDGEQRYLPVLSNKQQLTESVLLNVNGAGEYVFSLENLFNGHSKTVSRPKMTVEFTGNPLWYAVQALKVVENPETDNVLSWAVAYYANSLMDYLSRTQSHIADSLKVEGIKGKMTEAVLKLKDLQLADGSWSWYKGMSGSLYMTTAITQLMARLNQMTGGELDAEVVKMNQQAWGYLNKQLAEEMKWMKEAEKKGGNYLNPSEMVLQCLYTDALEKNQCMAADVRKYFVGKLEKMSGQLTIYGKSLSAIILQEAGKTDKAKKFLESVMQYSVMTEEMGRYFDTPKAEYSWFSYRIPTQVAAIEAIHRVTHEEKTQEDMKRWLLKQKQAQAWGTPVATADAVYALLMTGENGLQHTGAAEIRVGKQVIRTSNDALGYVRQEVAGNVLNIRKVTVEKESAGIGWGAVCAEFEEDMDQVTAQGHALEISRTLYRDGKPLLVGTTLKVGDKLTVRLTLKADRDMDFVQVKDNRAAFMEPVDALSGYCWNRTLSYYRENKDATTSFFIERLRKGTHEMEYEVYVTSSGQYIQGIPTVQSVYAPEFVGHGESGKWIIE